MKTFTNKHLLIWTSIATALLGGSSGYANASGTKTAPVALSLGADPAAGCAALAGSPIPASAIGLPSGNATIDSAVIQAPIEVAVAERAPSPAARITPAQPSFCRVIGRIAPVDPSAPPIMFQVNLPLQWNGRSVQYGGGGGFNGSLVTGLRLIPVGRFDQPAPLAQGYVTVGTDSGHQTAPGQPPLAFAANDEAFVNFAHASYKKVRDVSVALTRRAYGRAPAKMYYVGSSTGGREGLIMAQRYPADFDGIFSNVPVVGWTGLMHVMARSGLITMGDGWMGPAQIKLVHDAVLATCDAADGVADGLVANPVACKAIFDVRKLQCAAGASDNCLTAAQVQAVQTYQSSWKAPFALDNGVTQYPGWGVSGEATPGAGFSGGWGVWWLGASAPTLPPKPDNGNSWRFSNAVIQHVFTRDANFDVRKYRPEDYAARVLEVSRLMDGTNPDLSAFHAKGGKLIVLENMSDYAQSPYAGIGYYDSVVSRMGRGAVKSFVRLYTAPGVDHTGSGGPGNVDMLGALSAWVEQGKVPGTLLALDQEVAIPFAPRRALPLCEWPASPRYKEGDVKAAGSFECSK